MITPAIEPIQINAFLLTSSLGFVFRAGGMRLAVLTGDQPFFTIELE